MPLFLLFFFPKDEGMFKSYIRSLQINKVKGFTLIELLIVILIVGVLSVLAVREYSKYTERANLASYALPLIKDCFAELASYCASNPDGTIDLNNDNNSYPTCKGLKTGIQTDKGKVKFENTPNFRCMGNYFDFGDDVDTIYVLMDTASKYKLECKRVNLGSDSTLTGECKPVPI